MSAVVAEQSLEFVYPEGSRGPGKIALHAPYEVSHGEARCRVELAGLLPRAVEISGYSSLQALALALRFAEHQLRGFRDQGGRILFEGGAEFVIEVYFGRTE